MGLRHSRSVLSMNVSRRRIPHSRSHTTRRDESFCFHSLNLAQRDPPLPADHERGHSALPANTLAAERPAFGEFGRAQESLALCSNWLGTFQNPKMSEVAFIIDIEHIPSSGARQLVSPCLHLGQQFGTNRPTASLVAFG